MKHNIDQLLNKYWEGETSEVEENIIKEYYRNGKADVQHQPFAELFGYFDAQSKISVPVIEYSKPTLKVVSSKRWMYGVAAAMVLVIGSLFIMRNMNNVISPTTSSMVQAGEIEDPEEALRVTKEALALVSRKFNKSKNTVKEKMVNLDKATIFK